MKLLLVIVPILAVFTADCWAFSNEPGRQQTSDTPLVFPSGTETPEEWQKFGGRLETLDSTDNEKEEEILYVRKGKGSICKAKTTCDLLGGSCVTNATLCSGRLVAKGCKGTNCQCCVPGIIEAELKNLKEGIQSFRDGMNTSAVKFSSELQIIKNNINKMNSSIHSELSSLGKIQVCSTSKGYFLAPGTNQCMKVFLDTLRTWPQADAKCKSVGMVLAKPSNPVPLHKYLIDKHYGSIGNQWYWLNAKGDGSAMKWQYYVGGEAKVPNSSPLYVDGTPSGSSVSTSYCLQIATYPSYIKSKPGKVYVTRSCTGDREYALCEMK